MTMQETQRKLEQWGRWQRGQITIGYSSVLGRLRGSTLQSAMISDEDAGRIDSVVAALKKTNYEQYRCIKLSYAQEMSRRAIARELKISHSTVERRIEAAEHWLDVAFDVENI